MNGVEIPHDSKLMFNHGSITYDFLPYFFRIPFCDRDVLLFIFNPCSNEEKPKLKTKLRRRENTAVKEAGKAERKAVAQKKEMPGKEKKPSIHERLEINKRIIQEKQGKDKPERGADLGVR